MGWLDETYKSTTKKTNSYLDPIKKKVGATTGSIKNSHTELKNKFEKSPKDVLLNPEWQSRHATETVEKAVTGDKKLTHQFGKAFGGKTAEDRLAGAIKGGTTGAAAGSYFGPIGSVVGGIGGAIVGGATGSEAINKGMSGKPVVGKTGGGGGGGPTGKGNIDPAVIEAIKTGGAPGTGSAPGDTTPGSLPATPAAAFQGYNPTGISVDPIKALKAKAVADMKSPDPIVAAKAAKVLGINPASLPQVQAEMVKLGDKSEFLQGQRDLVKILQGRVAGTAGPSLAELQLKKAQQDMINQMAAQAGSMSGRALPAAQRQLMQAQQQSGQQLAMDAAILRAQEQKTAEETLSGALGQYRGQDIERTGLQLDADIADQTAALKADTLNQDATLRALMANMDTETKIALGNLDAETKALIANQDVDLKTKMANLTKNTDLSVAELVEATKVLTGNQTTELEIAKYDEDQKYKAAKLAEDIKIAEEGIRIKEETLAQSEKDSIRTNLTNLAIGDMKGTQAKEARDDELRNDLTGEILKGAGQLGAEWYNSDSDGEDFNVDDELLNQAISEGY